MSEVLDVAREVVHFVLVVLAWPTLLYFLLINSSYLVLVLTASADFSHKMRRAGFSGVDEVAASPLTQPISVIMPAFNESVGIVSAVMAMLALRYPEHEVIVLDDGSTDDTLDTLRAAFGLVEVPRTVPAAVPMRQAPQRVFVPADGFTPLVVVHKKNSGRADSCNVGINVARYPLVVFIDSDSILDPDSLLVAAKPFSDDPDRVVASGGAIRAANGCRVVAGRVVEVRMAKQWIVRIQVVEYLRAFVLGRAGWSKLQAMLIISGAFGLFKRATLIEVGGADADCIGEDMELVVRIHRRLREAKRDYRIVYMAEPTLWTEVPSTHAVLARQRRRWHRGLWEVLWKHRAMLFNPRYGRIGLVAIPYFWIFELLAPILELLGLVLVPLALALGVVNSADNMIRLMLVAYAYAMVVTLAALAIEELSYHRYDRWSDLVKAIAASIIENVGYRQINAWWRLQGLWQGIRGGKAEWGVMTRTGFGDTGASS